MFTVHLYVSATRVYSPLICVCHTSPLICVCHTCLQSTYMCLPHVFTVHLYVSATVFTVHLYVSATRVCHSVYSPLICVCHTCLQSTYMCLPHTCLQSCGHVKHYHLYVFATHVFTVVWTCKTLRSLCMPSMNVCIG